MGHRANFVLIRDGKAEAFYDQWAALGSTYVFAAGPDEADSTARASEPTSELIDWAFAEAGYLIDYDEKVAIVFGFPEIFDPEDFDDLPPETEAEMKNATQLEEALMAGPAAFLEHIASQWPGWLLRWDERGVDAFAEHLQRRQIQAIATQPFDHPQDVSKAEHQA